VRESGNPSGLAMIESVQPGHVVSVGRRILLKSTALTPLIPKARLVSSFSCLRGALLANLKSKINGVSVN